MEKMISAPEIRVSDRYFKSVPEVTVDLPQMSGRKMISSAEDVFYVISWDFQQTVYYPDPTTRKTTVKVWGTESCGTFSQIYHSMGVELIDLCLTQSQIIWFVSQHKSSLTFEATFFLFKFGNRFYVAAVTKPADNGTICVRRYSLYHEFIWSAGRYGFVLPSR